MKHTLRCHGSGESEGILDMANEVAVDGRQSR
jgi:hypothetical protein